MVDRCVCCGAVIPEGTEVCINCRYQYLDQYSESGGTPSGSFADSSVSKTRGRDKHKMPRRSQSRSPFISYRIL